MVKGLDDFVAEVCVEAVLFASLEGDDEDLAASFQRQVVERQEFGL